jgi:hypothetical protein
MLTRIHQVDTSSYTSDSMRDVPGSNLGYDIVMSEVFFCGFLQSFKANAGMVPQLTHNQFSCSFERYVVRAVEAATLGDIRFNSIYEPFRL